MIKSTCCSSKESGLISLVVSHFTDTAYIRLHYLSDKGSGPYTVTWQRTFITICSQPSVTLVVDSCTHVLLWWFEYAWPVVYDTIRKCGLVGIDGALLEEVCHCVDMV